MQFDDRLATVLRMHPGTERAANTQYRQLLDLLGSAPSGADGELLERAYSRLEALSTQIPAARRSLGPAMHRLPSRQSQTGETRNHLLLLSFR